MPYQPPPKGREHGIHLAASIGRALMDVRWREAMDDFRRLDSDEARAAFADKWVRLVSSRLDETWPLFYELLRIIRDRKLYEHPSFMTDRKPRASFEEYWGHVVQKPFSTWEELEKTHHFVETYRQDLIDGPLSEAEAVRKHAEAAAANPVKSGDALKLAQAEGGKTGGRGKKKPSSCNNEGLRGDSSSYLSRRIAAHHPTILDRMKAGEFKSVRAAALEAGIVKPTVAVPLDPDKAARILRRHFHGDRLARLIAALSADAPEDPTR